MRCRPRLPERSPKVSTFRLPWGERNVRGRLFISSRNGLEGTAKQRAHIGVTQSEVVRTRCQRCVVQSHWSLWPGNATGPTEAAEIVFSGGGERLSRSRGG